MSKLKEELQEVIKEIEDTNDKINIKITAISLDGCFQSCMIYAGVAILGYIIISIWL